MKYLLITLMWAGYCLLHSFLISIRFTNLMARLLKNYYAFFRIFFVSFSIVLLIPLIGRESVIGWKFGSTRRFYLIGYCFSQHALQKNVSTK